MHLKQVGFWFSEDSGASAGVHTFLTLIHTMQVALGAVLGLAFAEVWVQVVAPALLAPLAARLCASRLGEALRLRDSTGLPDPHALERAALVAWRVGKGS